MCSFMFSQPPHLLLLLRVVGGRAVSAEAATDVNRGHACGEVRRQWRAALQCIVHKERLLRTSGMASGVNQYFPPGGSAANSCALCVWDTSPAWLLHPHANERMPSSSVRAP